MTEQRPPARWRITQEAGITVGLVVLGAWGFVGSTSHVLKLAREHGQDSWMAWNVAGPVELLALLAGLEIRLRHLAGIPARFPKFVAGVCVAFVLAANLSQADKGFAKWDGWAWIVSSVGAACFLLAFGMLETRSGRRTVKAVKPAERPATPPRAAQQPAGDHREAKTAPRAAERPTAPPAAADAVGGRRTAKDAIVAELLQEARKAGPGWDPDSDEVATRYSKKKRMAQIYIAEVRQKLEEENAA